MSVSRSEGLYLEEAMSRYLKISLIALLALVFIVPVASARPVIVRGGFYGPGWYGPGWYGPGWYGPGWYGYDYAPTTGGVKFDTKMKDASVYLDGGYAGTVGQLKTFQLRPGTHNIELRDPSGQTIFQEKIDVLAGKTTK